MLTLDGKSPLTGKVDCVDERDCDCDVYSVHMSTACVHTRVPGKERHNNDNASS